MAPASVTLAFVAELLYKSTVLHATVPAGEYFSFERKPEFHLKTRVLKPRAHQGRGRRRESVKRIEIVAPEEDVGRDTISRFDMQFQAAAYAALEILQGKGVDCVYCDYHNDFVVREQIDGRPRYHFFQVKTKRKLNAQWGLGEVFDVRKRGQKADAGSLKKIRSSFAGKLLLQGIVFDDACSEVTLLSNIHFDDDVVTTVEELRGKTPKGAPAKFLSTNFSAIFEITPAKDSDSAAALLSKLSLRPAVTYIDKDRDAFASAARAAIFKYSEIDLDIHETTELATGLVDLVYKKSRTSLQGVQPEELEKVVGVGLDDLLHVLSISRAAYDALIAGADDKALKTASVIQRWLKGVGANELMIEFASQQKVKWDLWLRGARHAYSPIDLAALLGMIDNIYERWARSGLGFDFVDDLIQQLAGSPRISVFVGLDRELLLGAVASVVVRHHSR
jgi:hypothetical protein